MRVEPADRQVAPADSSSSLILVISMSDASKNISQVQVLLIEALAAAGGIGYR